MEALVLTSIFLAVVLLIIGIIILLKYRSFGSDKTELLDQKLNSVNNALDSCEKMIDELNRLSDYIISNVEAKSVELKGFINLADKRISALSPPPQPRFEARIEPEVPKIEEIDESPVKKPGRGRPRKTPQEAPVKEKAADETNNIVTPKNAAKAYKTNSDLTKQPKEEEQPRYIVDAVVLDDKENGGETGKMFAFVVSPKAKDVIELSKQGMDTTEIAKRLGIGKGEIELILGIKK